MTLELEIQVPDRVVLSEHIASFQAADASGRFGIRPGHEDFLTNLVPCVVRYRSGSGHERYAAVDGGVLLLESGRIRIVTRDAVLADHLNEVADAAARMLEVRRLAEHAARSGFAELETALIRELRKAVQRS